MSNLCFSCKKYVSEASICFHCQIEDYKNVIKKKHICIYYAPERKFFLTRDSCPIFFHRKGRKERWKVFLQGSTSAEVATAQLHWLLKSNHLTYQAVKILHLKKASVLKEI